MSICLLSECSACSTKPVAADVIGIDLGTTNSCVSVMEGKVCFFSVHSEICHILLFVNGLLYPSVVDVMLELLKLVWVSCCINMYLMSWLEIAAI
jgi:hypothetical protein